MPGAGNTQLIGGTPYAIGTPEWQKALETDNVRQAGLAGTASGTQAGNAALAQLRTITSGLGRNMGMIGAEPSAVDTRIPGMSGFLSSEMNSVLNAPTYGSYGSSGGVSGGAPITFGGSSGGSSSAPPPVANVTPVDSSAADSAAFGKAKDQVGLETSGALAGLRSSLGGRGLLGSGAESRGTMGVINKGQGELGDTSRALASKNADLAHSDSLANLSANVTQRGQTLAADNAEATLESENARTGYEGAIAQRGQDIQMQTANNQLALQQAKFAADQRQQALQGLVAALGPAARVY